MTNDFDAVQQSAAHMGRRQLLGASLGFGLAAAVPSAWAITSAPDAVRLNWPRKPVRIVVGFGGGSSPDLTARTFIEPLSKILGQPVIVENKVGAGGAIAAAEVARANDDHTIGLMINANLTIVKILNPRSTYDPLTELAPISLVGTAPLVLAASNTVAAGDVPAFFAAARQQGTQWNYGSPGVGTIGHLGMELIKARTKLAPIHVPYAGYAQVAAALATGELHMALLPPALARAQELAGKVQLLGVTSNGRSTQIPHVPTLGELGVGLIGLDLQVWNAFATGANVSLAVRERMAAAIAQAARSPVVRQQLFVQGWQVVATAPEGLARRISQETEAMAKLIARLREQNLLD